MSALPPSQPEELSSVEDLYTEHHHFVEAIIFNNLPQYLRDEQLVLELAQDVWVTVIEQFDRFKEQVKNGVPIKATLFAIARNRASGYRRTKKSENQKVSSI